MLNKFSYSKLGSRNDFIREQEYKIVVAMSSLGASSFRSATLLVAVPSRGKGKNVSLFSKVGVR